MRCAIKSLNTISYYRLLFLCIVSLQPVSADERTEHFDRDPHWDSRNNRISDSKPRTVVQDFGYSRTSHAGGQAGEIGGLISPAAEPAYYGKKIDPKSFNDQLTASGTLSCTGRPFHVLVGFFNVGTLNEWRTPSTIALRLSGRGDVFYAWLEYATARWRAGGDDPRGFPTERDSVTGRQQLKGFPAKGSYRWTLRYEPDGNDGAGVITATIGNETAVCNLAQGHKADGATFDHFGLLTVMKSADTGGELWLDDISINGDNEDFSVDPGWDGFQNRRTYETRNVRPWFDFGFSPTQYAGGAGRGELGGLIFRGDCRYPHKIAYYGDRIDMLNMEKSLRASGKVCLRRGVTDSTVLIGFFHSEASTTVNPSQDNGLPKNFLGVAIEGPSREGFYFAPAYRLAGHGHGYATKNPPHIYPDGKPHDWTLEYDPTTGAGEGRIAVTLDKESVRLSVPRDQPGTQFDRFGIVTTWIDGNAEQVYFDDLTYTHKQD
jgi:hypothetical protein